MKFGIYPIAKIGSYIKEQKVIYKQAYIEIPTMFFLKHFSELNIKYDVKKPVMYEAMLPPNNPQNV
jgi:hypothetical protein